MGETMPLWRRIIPGDVPWEQFHDSHGRPTTPVRNLASSGGGNIIEAKFPPNFYAGEHWHDFDSVYFVTHDSMQSRFGAQGSVSSRRYPPGKGWS
jgi:hypothetical protein